MRYLRSISPQRHDFPALDGLRGLAVVLVLMVHVAGCLSEQGSPAVRSALLTVRPLTNLGGTGVHLFFVLSGFLLFLPYARSVVHGREWPSTRSFFVRRARRILPAYYVAIGVIGLTLERDRIAPHAVEQVVTHVFLVHTWSPATLGGIDGPTWTLAIECQFYAMIPVLALLVRAAWRRGVVPTAALFAGLICAGPATVALTLVVKRIQPSWADHTTLLSPISFLGVFASGMACALLFEVHRSGARARLTVRLPQIGLLTAIVVYVALVCADYAQIDTSRLYYFGFGTIMAACYSGLLLWVVLRGRARVLATTPMRFLGDISFSVYLLHMPLLRDVVTPRVVHLPGLLPIAAEITGLILLVLPISLVSFLAIERPFLAQRRTIRTSQPGAAMTVDRPIQLIDLNTVAGRATGTAPAWQSPDR